MKWHTSDEQKWTMRRKRLSSMKLKKKKKLNEYFTGSEREKKAVLHITRIEHLLAIPKIKFIPQCFTRLLGSTAYFNLFIAFI